MLTSTTITVQLKTTPSLKHEAMWNLLGSLVYAGCQWLVLVATVKLSTAADVGRLSLAFALTAPVFLLLQLRLRAASATDAALAYTTRQYTLLRGACTGVAVAVTLLLCAGLHLPRAEAAIVLWVALAKAVESGSDLTYGLMQQRHNLRVVALSMAARGILSVVAFCLLLHGTHSLANAMAGLFAAWALVFAALDLPMAMHAARQQQPILNRAPGGIVRLAWLTLPLGLSTMFMSLSANMPRYFIQHSLGATALGVFSASAYLTMTGSVIISAIAESSIARMAQHFALGNATQARSILRRVRSLTLVLSAVLIAISYVAGRTILAHLYRAEYADNAGLLIVMMCAAAAANLASVYGYALIAARKFQSYLGCLVLSALTTAIACWFAVPRWTTTGAAAGCLIGYMIQFLVARALLEREFHPVAATPLPFVYVADAPVLKS